MNIIKPSVFIFFMCLTNYLHAQSIDSASVSYQNDTIFIYVEGRVMNYDLDAIENITIQSRLDSTFVEIYFRPCSSLQTFAPYDTNFSFQGPFSSGINSLRVYSILQRDTVGTCYGVKLNHEIIDTAYLSFNVPLSADEYELNNRLRPYPNPTGGKVSFDPNTSIDKITVLDATGQTIKTVYPSDGFIDISGYNSGIYILKSYSDNVIETHKLFKL